MPKRQSIRQICHIRFLAAACAIVVVAGCSEQPKSLPWLSPEATILAFGDSLTYGIGTSRDSSYPAVLSQSIGRRVVNAGVPGETTAEGLQRLPGVLDSHRPDLLLLCLGGNDFLRRSNAAAARDNLASMISLAKARSIPIVLIGVPQPGLFLDADPLYAGLAQQYDLALEEEIMPDVLGDKSLKSDTVHPNTLGYRKIAEALEKLLRASGAI